MKRLIFFGFGLLLAATVSGCCCWPCCNSGCGYGGCGPGGCPVPGGAVSTGAMYSPPCSSCAY